MRTRYPIVQTPLLATLVAAGASAATPASSDPCRLLTAADAQAVLGIPVVAEAGGPDLCSYHRAGGGGPELVVVSASVPDPARAKAGFTRARNATKEAVDIPGVGDEAFGASYLPHSSRQLPGGGRVLTFLKGSTAVTLKLDAPSSAVSYQDRLIAAGKKAAPRV